MTSDSLERAELLDLEVEVLAMLLRRLPRGVVQGKDADLQAELEPAQREETRSVVPAHQEAELASDRVEAPADEA